MNRHHHKNKYRLQLDRIERKCDRILSELIIIRRQRVTHSDIDSVIDNLHQSARAMRMQAERERENIRRMFNSKLSEL